MKCYVKWDFYVIVFLHSYLSFIPLYVFDCCLQSMHHVNMSLYSVLFITYYISYVISIIYIRVFFSVKTPFARQIIHFLMPLLFINHSVPPLTQFHKVLLNTWFSCEYFVYSTCFQLDVSSLNLNCWFYIDKRTTISVKNMFSTSCISHVV